MLVSIGPAAPNQGGANAKLHRTRFPDLHCCRDPRCRASEIFDFELMGLRFTVRVSRYPDGRPVCEPRVKLPSCGRGLGPCEAVIETNTAGTCLRCLTCDCVAPYPLKANKNAV